MSTPDNNEAVDEPTSSNEAPAVITISAVRETQLPNKYWTLYELHNSEGVCFTSCLLNAVTGEVNVEKAVLYCGLCEQLPCKDICAWQTYGRVSGVLEQRVFFLQCTFKAWRKILEDVFVKKYWIQKNYTPSGSGASDAKQVKDKSWPYFIILKSLKDQVGVGRCAPFMVI